MLTFPDDDRATVTPLACDDVNGKLSDDVPGWDTPVAHSVR
jgi:hypothetical protein